MKNIRKLNLQINPNDLKLVARTTKRIGKSAPAQYWNIFLNDKRVGKVYINFHTDKDCAAYVTVMINKDMQGRGIGTQAFQTACLICEYDVVFAELRRSNKASKRALEKAGFVPFGRNLSGEDILVRRRGDQTTTCDSSKSV